LSHSWSISGDFTIKAKLIDEFGAEGEWGKLTVTMPRNIEKNLKPKLLDCFFNSHPNLPLSLWQLIQK